MPAREVWAGFFDLELFILFRSRLATHSQCMADFGCGYGTFTILAAGMVPGIVHFLDSTPDIMAATSAKANNQGLNNLRAGKWDFVAEGCGLPDENVDYVILFNILHAAETPHDASTPRGPSMSIRLRPAQCI